MEASSERHPLGLSKLVLSGVFRVPTHPRIFHPPTPSDAAVAFVDAILAQPGNSTLQPSAGHWRIFRNLTLSLRLTGNRVPDAFHAAPALEHGCEWVTLDRGFSIFPGLQQLNLLDA